MDIAKPLGTTANGFEIFAGPRLRANNGLFDDMRWHWATLTPGSNSDHLALIDVGMVVEGVKVVVPVTAADNVFYAKRYGAFGYSKFVHDRTPVGSRFITAMLRPNTRFGKRVFECVALYRGEHSPREPWACVDDPKAFAESVTFWSAHAFCLGTPDTPAYDFTTERPTCPWPTEPRVRESVGT